MKIKPIKYEGEKVTVELSAKEASAGKKRFFVVITDGNEQPVITDQPRVTLESDSKMPLHVKAYAFEVHPVTSMPKVKEAVKKLLLEHGEHELVSGNHNKRFAHTDSGNATIDFPTEKSDVIQVALQRSATQATDDISLWALIRQSAEAMKFDNYANYVGKVLCDDQKDGVQKTSDLYLPFTDANAYRRLKVATEAFVVTSCEVREEHPTPTFSTEDNEEAGRRIRSAGPEPLGKMWASYTKKEKLIPYLAIVRDKLQRDTTNPRDVKSEECIQAFQEKMKRPFLMELIWSYWHEEAMLVQTMNAISRRYQNIRGPEGSDPLAHLELSPLRPLNNLLWGYIQDDQHRLSLVRRAHEYDHQYAFKLYGKAVPAMRSVESRSKFMGAFHSLLHTCSSFYTQDDNTTVIANGFSVLNALKETHLVLAEGADNQWGNLTSTARVEMLMQQWLLARPELQEFLPGHPMVANKEPWMDRVDTANKLFRQYGRPDARVAHFNDLAVFGEQILLSIRYGDWSNVSKSEQAANWARYWRSEIQGYMHAYRVVTGVDVNVTPDDTVPGVHLQRRLLAA